MITRWISLNEAAQLLSVPVDDVLRLVQDGSLSRSPTWLGGRVERAAVERMARLRVTVDGTDVATASALGLQVRALVARRGTP